MLNPLSHPGIPEFIFLKKITSLSCFGIKTILVSQNESSALLSLFSEEACVGLVFFSSVFDRIHQ